jgi:hypothetical protein
VLAAVLEPHAPGAARAIVIAFMVIGLLVSGLLNGQWLLGGLDEATFGPAFVLPGIGIGFVGADAAATVGLHSIAELFFGIGVAGWVLISSVAQNRFFFVFALRWLHLEHPPGGGACGWGLVAVISAFVGAIAARTIVAAVR